MTDIRENWIFAEKSINKINSATFQLITKMKSISEIPVTVVLLESQADSFENEIKQYGPDKILTVKDDELDKADDVSVASALSGLIDKFGTPISFIFAATTFGRSVAPRLQAKLLTGLTADCLDLSFEDDLLVQTKPSYGDNIMCEIVIPDFKPQMATVRPNIFKAEKVFDDTTKIVEINDLNWDKDANIQITTHVLPAKTDENLATADRIVALGRGGKQDLNNANELANKINATVGVTRPLTDMDEFDQSQQIGQSGETVAPDLLINLGVSGSVQFTAGIENANTIVSVNTDKHAPIFKQSDYCFNGSSEDFLKALNKVL
ncbi:electron transfer flavoprotein subunit alpha/FixB family protein [Companilactobacillus mishanensis]|uniref:Electron transfer flavoprotein subunit alpha/FixB family protein n=1 Tax=Companilactobacillus mishanensis TaxID=2486008 RepID=A0ABW9P7F5_9LACO|nr:electron transfer flavoprotein subunit alpha/FixB family protein [Companilactobacillus mishanensis]MQS45163.1 electron transfer flavoprotein subunit alpha/FixB family protein [Companilactobacillus mishanensis]